MKKRTGSGKKITGTDVARAAGCSQSSVSKVINNHPHVSGALRKKVMAAASELDYDWNPRRKLQRVALILPAPWRFRLDGYVASLLDTMIYVLHRREVRMEIVQEDDLDVLQSHVFDGGISISWEPELTGAWFERFQLPLVRINTNPELSGRRNLLAYVNMDSEQSMRLLLEKLYSLNHRRIILLAPDPPEIERKRKRYTGFCRYLRERHVIRPEQRCIFDMRAHTFEENRGLLKQAVSEGATALIAVDEGAARNALNLIGSLKLNVPGRISVVSWEQKDVLSYFDPPISGMSIDYTQLSEAAVDLLSALCRGEEVSDVYFPFRMIERESIAPAYRKRTRGQLAQRILEMLKGGPETRSRIASVLGVKPYSGHFNRTLLDLLNAGRITYGEKSGGGRNRLLKLSAEGGAEQ